jgi:hypothetical protein
MKLVFIGLGGRLRTVVMLGRRTCAGLPARIGRSACAGLFRWIAGVCRAVLLAVGLLRRSRARGRLCERSAAQCQAQAKGRGSKLRFVKHVLPPWVVIQYAPLDPSRLRRVGLLAPTSGAPAD